MKKKTRVRIFRTGLLIALALALAGGIYALCRFPRLREFAVILFVSTIFSIVLQIAEERSASEGMSIHDTQTYTASKND